jgi:ankyrin repeat protein
MYSLDIHGFSPFGTAVLEGHLDITGFLLNNGANVNALNSRGVSIFSLAIAADLIDVVALLISRGVDIVGSNALRFSLNSERTTNMLIESGAINTPDIATILHDAVNQDNFNLEVFELLIVNYLASGLIPIIGENNHNNAFSE